MKTLFSSLALGLAILSWPFRKIDNFISDLLQKAYLAFYDITGVTLGDIQSALVISGIPFAKGLKDYICAAFLLFFCQVRAILQRVEQIELINNEAMVQRTYLIWCRLIFIGIWLADFKTEYIFFIPLLISFCIMIRKRDKDRFKKQIPAAEGSGA